MFLAARAQCPFRGADGVPIVIVATGVRAGAASTAAGTGAAGTTPAPFEPIEILTSAFRDEKKDAEWQRQRLSIAIPDTTPGQLRYEAISALPLEQGGYNMDHTAIVYRMDKNGQFVAPFSMKRRPEDAAADLRKYL